MMSNCIDWTGARDRDGYGMVKRQGRMWFAHRWVWYKANGPIPKGMLVCHACDNPGCVNLDHLWLGSARDNVMDMYAKGRQVKERPWQKHDTCPHGHPYTHENGVQRFCRTCQTEAVRRYRERKRAQ